MIMSYFVFVVKRDKTIGNQATYFWRHKMFTLLSPSANDPLYNVKFGGVSSFLSYYKILYNYAHCYDYFYCTIS